MQFTCLKLGFLKLRIGKAEWGSQLFSLDNLFYEAVGFVIAFCNHRVSEAAALLLHFPNSWLSGAMSQFRTWAFGSDSATPVIHTQTHTSPYTHGCFISIAASTF